MEDEWGELRSEVHKCIENDRWSTTLGKMLMSYDGVEFFDALTYVMGAIRNSTTLTWGLKKFLARSESRRQRNNRESIKRVKRPSPFKQDLLEAISLAAGTPPNPIVLTSHELRQIQQADLAARSYKWGDDE